MIQKNQEKMKPWYHPEHLYKDVKMHVGLKRRSLMFCYRNVGSVVGSPVLFVNKIICT